MTRLQHVFQPLSIGACEIPNRFVVTAMVTNFCTEDGMATERYIAYHEEKAKGGYGLILTENYAVNRHAMGYRCIGGMWKDEHIASHKELVDRVHRHGTKIFCQIYHAGRQSKSSVNGGVQPIAASPIPCPWTREVPMEMSLELIKEVVRNFGEAAARVRKAGFDGLEIHAGHGYLIASFLSFHQNKRTDEYGGCFTNRVRFLKEIIEAVRANVGNDFPVMVRFSADENVLGGRTIAESRQLAKLLEEWGINAINCSNGVYGTFNTGIVAPMHLPPAFSAHNAAELKKMVKIPVMAVNRINDPAIAETLLSLGYCDFVAMSRASLADPGMPNKAKEERLTEIRPCIGCLQGCTEALYRDEPLRCLVNPEMGREFEYTYKNKPQSKKVLVIGGGVAGMEAAISAARMGHAVTIWEKSSKLGGQIIPAAFPPGKGELAGFTAWMIQEVKRLGVTVAMEKEATAEMIKDFCADKVILATGGVPNKPRIPGIDSANVYMAADVLVGKFSPQGRIIVAGGGEVGLETALFMADAERGDITVVELLDKINKNGEPVKRVHMMKMAKERDLRFMTETKVLEICDDGILLECKGEKNKLPCDYVVVSMGYHSNTDMKDSLGFLGDKLVVVGDAVKSANILEAAATGFDAGYNA